MELVNKLQEGNQLETLIGVTPQELSTGLGIETVKDLEDWLRLTKRDPLLYDLQKFMEDNEPQNMIDNMTPFLWWIFEELKTPGKVKIPDIYLKQLTPNKQVTLNKNGGSLLDLLKELLPDSEIFDLILHFGIDELLEGGLKNTGSISIQIMVDSEDSNEKVPEFKTIILGDEEYEVEVADTPEKKRKGLSGRDSLDEDKGMLFDFEHELPDVSFWMKDTHIPLDIIFINKDNKVTKVYKGEPEDETLITVKNVRYVVELNLNSGVTKGDELEFDSEDDGPVMKVLAPDGSTLMELKGGERIFSRKNTKTLIRMAKRADKSKLDKDYKRLGRRMFSYIHTQDTNKPEYVEVPED